MRCQRVRSYLSAYCREELIGRQQLAVKEHLAGCESCRRQEEFQRVMIQKLADLRGPALPADFNTKLLNRLAQERFSETRTKAYLPKRAPTVMWSRLVPVLAGVSVVLFAAVSMLGNRFGVSETSWASSGLSSPLDDSYLTVQPIGNRNMTSKLRQDWTLESQMRQTARFNRLSGMLTSSNGFGSESHGTLEMTNPFTGERMPYTVIIFRMRPVVRVYEPNSTPQVEGANSIY